MLYNYHFIFCTEPIPGKCLFAFFTFLLSPFNVEVDDQKIGSKPKVHDHHHQLEYIYI